MWEWPHQHLDENTCRYYAATGTRLLSWGEVLALWTDDSAFSDAFGSVLAETPWAAFRWETPPLLQNGLDGPFEFVIVNSPELAGAPDPSPFAAHFRRAGRRTIVTFANLGGDAELVVPCPRTDDAVYTHLAQFVRNAPRRQQRALWHEVGLAMERRVGDIPVWLSTAGGGVAWLHVRLDDRPKYYAHAAYRRPPSPSE
ncbi:MAG: hypothetical protein WD397_15640 [Wenzhouxiangellaceae bacterium]